MGNNKIVVIGASAGGIEALLQVVNGLPESFPAAILVVVHLRPWHESLLGTILDRAGALPATEAKDGAQIQPGHIYVAPSDHHLLMEGRRLLVVRGPKENRQRPSIDALFRSAAVACGSKIIGVLLSGNLDDGTAGLWHIKRAGGVAIVQDPKNAQHPGMVKSALSQVEVDHVVPLSQMAPLLTRLVQIPAPPSKDHEVTEAMKTEDKIARMEDDPGDIYELGQPSQYVCPECSGTLFKMREGKLSRYRCRVGHAYSKLALLAEQAEATEGALWTGMRALREQVDLLKSSAHEYPVGSELRRKLYELSKKADGQAIQIRKLIENNEETLVALRESEPKPIGATPLRLEASGETRQRKGVRARLHTYGRRQAKLRRRSRA